MAVDPAVVFTNVTGTFPDVEAINASGAGTTDGTEFIATMVNNWMFGVQQALLDYADIIPNGVVEAAGASQVLDAWQKSFGIGPGMLVGWFLDEDPATTGHRVLLLEGVNIVHADYPELRDAVYVGDANNATAGCFYKSSDSGGTIRDTSGIYLVLPDLRGRVLRGLDLSGLTDPDGASRTVGDEQEDAFQGHRFEYQDTVNQWTLGRALIGQSGTGFGAFALSKGSYAEDTTRQRFATDSINGTPRISSETRMKNISIRYGITY
jgi:hypothetical protein